MRFEDEEAESLVFGVGGGEHHPFGNTKAHLARREVRDHDRELALQVFGLVGALDAGEDVAGSAFTEVKREAQELRRTFDFVALDDLRHAQVDLREVVDRALFGHGFAAREFGHRDGFGDNRHVGQQAVELLFHVDALHQMLEGLNRMLGRERRRHARPEERIDREERFDAFGRSRQNGLQEEREEAEAFERDRAHPMELLGRFGILGELPGLFLIDELVDAVGEFHHEARRTGEFARFVVVLHLVGAFADRFEEGIVHRGVVHAAFEAFHDEARSTARDVDVLADQVRIDATSEVGLREVDVFDAGIELGGEVVAQPFGVHAELEVLQGRDARTAALRHFFAVHRHEAVCVHMVGRAEGLAGKVQHRRPEERVEVDDVLADEVDLLGVFGREFLLEVEPHLVTVRLERGEVADGSVEPDIEVLARGVGNFNAEIRCVAGDVPVGKAPFDTEPFVVLREDLFLNGGRAVGAAAARPTAEEFNALRVRKTEEIVRGGLQNGGRTREGRVGVHDFGRRVDRRALFAVVAVLVGRAATRAGALDEAVGEEHVLLRVVELFDFLRVDEARVLKAQVDLTRKFVVFRSVRAVPVVEADVKTIKVLTAAGGDFGYERLGRDAALLGRNHDGCAVHVVRAHEVHAVARHAFVADPNVGLDVLHDVAHVEGAVRIRQGGGDEKIALCHLRGKSRSLRGEAPRRWARHLADRNIRKADIVVSFVGTLGQSRGSALGGNGRMTRSAGVQTAFRHFMRTAQGRKHDCNENPIRSRACGAGRSRDRDRLRYLEDVEEPDGRRRRQRRSLNRARLSGSSSRAGGRRTRGRSAQGRGCRRRHRERHAEHHRAQGSGDASRHAGREKHHRREFRQGRGRQVHRLREPCARARLRRRDGRRSRRGQNNINQNIISSKKMQGK